ncbi:MAG: hypothetical protein ACM3N9_04475, partial [Syntrophothermus sp.]
MKKLLLLLAILLTLGLNPAKATIRLVPSVYPTIHEAVAAAVAGDVIHVETGIIIETALTDIDKSITIEGEGAANSLIRISGTGHIFKISADGVTIKGLKILKIDNLGVQNIIGIQANNFTLENCTVQGQYFFGDEGPAARAMEFYAGTFSGQVITGNTFLAVRQPAYINGTHTGTISN